MSADLPSFSHCSATSNYSYRVPTPPRIIVPPPILGCDSLPDFTLNIRAPDSFLNTVSYNRLIQQNALMEWNYERRREAQLILPFLYLGPMASVKEDFLHSHGITMVLGVRQKQTEGIQSKIMDAALRRAGIAGVETQTVDLSGNAELIRNFSSTIEGINQHLARMHHLTSGSQMGKVLVFCESGNERSAGIVAAYLMDTHTDVDHIKAMQVVQAQRFCANFDDAMKRLLEGYWDILCAQRAVAGVHKTEEGKGKRGLERDEDEDEEMNGGQSERDDWARFEGRSYAPFQDPEG